MHLEVSKFCILVKWPVLSDCGLCFCCSAPKEVKAQKGLISCMFGFEKKPKTVYSHSQIGINRASMILLSRVCVHCFIIGNIIIIEHKLKTSE